LTKLRVQQKLCHFWATLYVNIICPYRAEHQRVKWMLRSIGSWN